MEPIIVTNYVSMATILNSKTQIETATKLADTVNERAHRDLFRKDILVILNFEDLFCYTTPVSKSVYSLLRDFLTGDSKRQIIVQTEDMDLATDEFVREFSEFGLKKITCKEEGEDSRWEHMNVI